MIWVSIPLIPVPRTLWEGLVELGFRVYGELRSRCRWEVGIVRKVFLKEGPVDINMLRRTSSPERELPDGSSGDKHPESPIPHI